MTSFVNSARNGCRSIEIWLTPCAISMPPSSRPSTNNTRNEMLTLLNSANVRLCGTQFSHFPVGGPTPSAPVIGEPTGPPSNLGSVRGATWGLYPCESVDGTVTELGGQELERLCKALPVDLAHPDAPVGQEERYPIRCPVGEARFTPAAGSLRQVFDGGIVHAVAPFWPFPDKGWVQDFSMVDDKEKIQTWKHLLKSAYNQGFELAFRSEKASNDYSKIQNNTNINHSNQDNGKTSRSSSLSSALVCPLMGAGARGAPLEHVANVAISSAADWCRNTGSNKEEVIRFGVIEDWHADILSDLLDDYEI